MNCSQQRLMKRSSQSHVTNNNIGCGRPWSCTQCACLWLEIATSVSTAKLAIGAHVMAVAKGSVLIKEIVAPAHKGPRISLPPRPANPWRGACSFPSDDRAPSQLDRHRPP